ncbi:MAG: HDOD domain-containing protein [Myxococcota bacterium]
MNPNYGRGIHSVNEADASLFDDPTERILALFRREDYRPPLLPKVALEVNALIKRPNVGMEEIIELISTDPMIAASMLHRAASPMYKTKVAPRSLKDACMRLGLKEIQNLVWIVAMESTLFRSKRYGEVMNSVKDHSIKVARACQFLSDQTQYPSDHLFLCGLLHDMGTAAALAIVDSPKLKDLDDLSADLLASAIDSAHEHAGGAVCKAWELSDEIRWIVEHHHCPRMDGRINPLAAIVTIADDLVRGEGFGIPLLDNADYTPQEEVHQSWHGLGISNDVRAALEKQIRAKVADWE